MPCAGRSQPRRARPPRRPGRSRDNVPAWSESRAIPRWPMRVPGFQGCECAWSWFQKPATLCTARPAACWRGGPIARCSLVVLIFPDACCRLFAQLLDSLCREADGRRRNTERQVSAAIGSYGSSANVAPTVRHLGFANWASHISIVSIVSIRSRNGIKGQWPTAPHAATRHVSGPVKPRCRTLSLVNTGGTNRTCVDKVMSLAV